VVKPVISVSGKAYSHSIPKGVVDGSMTSIGFTFNPFLFFQRGGGI